MITNEDFQAATTHAEEMKRQYPQIIKAKYDPKLRQIILILNFNGWFGFSPDAVQGLEGATAAQLKDMEISPSGFGVHFPQLDADLYLPSMMQGHFGSKNGWPPASALPAAASAAKPKPPPPAPIENSVAAPAKSQPVSPVLPRSGPIILPLTIKAMPASTLTDLAESIDHFFAQGSAAIGDPDALAAFHTLRNALETGEVRAASPEPSSPLGWTVNPWVKRGILLGFRLGSLVNMEGTHPQGQSILSFVDKSTYPARRFTPAEGIRIVPGGSSVRAGAYVAPGVVIMPPAYINVGAYVGEGTMVDSHALVGSCAQIGRRVHLSAAAQIGGVLEPVNASPVIIEDDVLVGGNTGVYEGTVVRAKAVLAAGVILTRGTPVYDLVTDEIHRATPDLPLIIPSGAVVVPGSRAITGGQGREWGLSVATPVIVKYRDEKTELSVVLEEVLR